MPRILSLSRPRLGKRAPKAQPEEDSSISSTESRSAATKEGAGKVLKKVQRQLRRLDEMLHHVTHTKHHGTRQRAVSFPTSISPPIDIAPAFVTLPPSSPARVRCDSTHVKFVSAPDSRSMTSSEHSFESNQLPNLSADVKPVERVDMPADRPSEPVEQAVEVAEAPVAPVEQVQAQNALSASELPALIPEVLVAPETPDPFLIDDDGDALSEEEHADSADVSQATASPADNIPLDLEPEPEPVSVPQAELAPASAPTQLELQPQPEVPLTSPLLNLDKDVPPPPTDDDDDEEEEEEEEAPDLYVPALVMPTMFLPIPNTDPLTTLLNKYIYPPERRPSRDLTGDWQRNDFHTLVMTNSWRALARMARDRLVTADASDLTLILGLWHLRLSCLARLRLFNQTSAECTNLFSALHAIEPQEARDYVFERLLPFELEVMQTRLKYWTGDHMGYLDALSALLRKCRTKCRAAGGDEALVPMWKERGARVVLIMASQLVEMKEMTAATKLLTPLCAQPNPTLRSALARIYLQAGDVAAASHHFTLVASDPAAPTSQKKANAALLAAARGDWEEASDELREILEGDPQDYVAVNNLSVALLAQGRVKEGIEVLETALNASPTSVVVAEPFLFNLSTLYELRSTAGFEKKKELLVGVAKWSGDGLRTTCLKMPAN